MRDFTNMYCDFHDNIYMYIFFSSLWPVLFCALKPVQLPKKAPSPPYKDLWPIFLDSHQPNQVKKSCTTKEISLVMNTF